MKLVLFGASGVVVLGVVAAMVVLARRRHHGGSPTQPVVPVPSPVTSAPVPPPGTPPSTVTVQLTGYSWFDNTPPGSSTISMPTVHKVAGGTGTFADPITAAVPGHVGPGVETPGGTVFYVADLKRYFIVEDSGATPMPPQKHFDLWVDGQGFPKSASTNAMDTLTGPHAAIFNPDPHQPVTVGSLTNASGLYV